MLIACALMPFAAWADEGITVLAPATLATPEHLRTTAVYLAVDNPSLEPDEIIAAESPVAGNAELNNTAFEGGKPKPYPVGSILILPASVTALGPGGAHIKLIGLERALEVGDEIPLTLTFRRAGIRKVSAKVLRAVDFVRLYPVETTMMTIKKLQAEQARKLAN